MDTSLIKAFLNSDGQVKQMPAKLKKRLPVYLYLAEKFEAGKQYGEKEVNEILHAWHTYGDPATLRRDLYDLKLLERSADGTVYEAPEALPDPEQLWSELGLG